VCESDWDTSGESNTNTPQSRQIFNFFVRPLAAVIGEAGGRFFPVTRNALSAKIMPSEKALPVIR
jgi:hypothetical protein